MIVVGRWTRYALLAAVAVAACAVVATALVGGGAEPETAPAASAEPAAVVTPSPTPTPEVDADPDRRFLALDGGGMLWRGTAGACAAGIAPTLERTSDAVTWRTATPAGAAQLLALTPGDGAGQAAVVIAQGDDCAPHALRTNAEGTAWQDDPDAGGDVDAAPAQVGGLPALATSAEGDALYVATTADNCAGVAFAVRDPGASVLRSLSCETGMNPDDPIAIDHADGRLYVWSGDILTSLEAR